MEEGSLLEQALRHGLGNSSPETGEFTKNVLILDVYPVEKTSECPIQELQELARLARRCNIFLQSKSFRWHYGGDGPVFGVHIGEERLAHLRAYCRYGPSVADEWMAIQFMWEMSTAVENDFAISCWDVEDGQVLLIQAAEALPEWLDQDPTDRHRYSCWIRGGKLHLIPEPHATLRYALSWLHNQDRNAAPAFPRIQNILLQSFRTIEEYSMSEQRIALVVPRKITFLIRTRPDLLHAAIQTFCERIDDPPPDLLKYSDWVWSTATVSRTNYAMLRTVVSPAWETAEFLPPVGVEVKRYRRQCKTDSTPHLRHAVHLGVKVVVGVEYLAEVNDQPMSLDRRVVSWSRIAGENQPGSSWILQSFQEGPNHASNDLSDILRCPVFPDEAPNISLHSHPDVSIKQQLLNAQKSVDEDEDFPMPLPDQVDDEAWLTLDDKGDIQGATDLNSILNRFQNFMVQPSDVGGVEIVRGPTRHDIRPRAFLNILHAALKGDALCFPSPNDAFFFDEDYDLMEESGGNEEHEPAAMRGIMV
jgi:SGT1 protein